MTGCSSSIYNGLLMRMFERFLSIIYLYMA